MSSKEEKKEDKEERKDEVAHTGSLNKTHPPKLPRRLRNSKSFWDSVCSTLQKNPLTKRLRERLWKISVPATITNTLWQGMKLSGIAADGAIVTTFYQIGLPVFATCFVVDAVQRMYAIKANKGITWQQAFESYREDHEYIRTAENALCFLSTLLGWTAGYKYLGEKLFQAGLPQLMANALGAGIGAAGVRFGALEITQVIEVKREKITKMDHALSLDMAACSFVEGVVRSIVSDQNLYAQLMDQSVPEKLAKTIDSVAVGGAGPAFSLGTLVTYPVGKLYRFFRPSYEKGGLGDDSQFRGTPTLLPLDQSDNTSTTDSPEEREEDKDRAGDEIGYKALV